MSAYHNNRLIREEIDRILRQNAKRQANLGIESTDDEIYRAAKLWENDLVEIAKLDPEFAYTLHAQND